MISALSLPLSEDLTDFTAILWQHRIGHRVIVHNNMQLILVEQGIEPQIIKQLYLLWNQGEDISSLMPPANTGIKQGFFLQIQRAWFSSCLIAISIFFAFLTELGNNSSLLQYFTIINPNGRLELLDSLRSIEIWRLITPIFLHFSMPHLIFNALWVWVIGSKIEYARGRTILVCLVLFAAIVSNLAQYISSGPLFGGLSGVVFALISYAWLLDFSGYTPKIGMPSALIWVMLLWLVAGYIGLLTAVGFGNIANTAHLAGLLSGFAFGLSERYLISRKGH